MSNAITELKDSVERYKTQIKNVRVYGKAATNELVCTLLSGGTAGAIGAYDEAKGKSRDNDEGITTAYVGPVPAALVAAGVGKAGAIAMLGDETGKLASAVGQGGVDAWSYVNGRRMWRRHQKNKGG